MIFDILAHPQGHFHVRNSHTKFGWISSNGLGGDSVTDRPTDGGDNNITFDLVKKILDKNG